MLLFSTFDLIALAWFIGCWIAYAITVEKTKYAQTGLNALVNGYRDLWMERLLTRDMRMVDAQVTASLQNGTAFFASTSLIAVGGTLTLFRSTEEMLQLMAQLPFGIVTTRLQWEAKLVGLLVIFVYAFFKFAWSYRLFNYVAIMVGAALPFRRAKRPRRGISCCGPRRSVARPDGTSTAASAPSFFRSAISAGSSGPRC
jgi:uncharacterized membrane protein